MRIKPSIKIAIILAVLIHLAIFWGFQMLSSKKQGTENKQEVLLKVEKRPEIEEFQIPPKPEEITQKPNAEINLKPITIYSSVKPNLSEEIKKDLNQALEEKIKEIDIDEALKESYKENNKIPPQEDTIRIVEGYQKLIAEHLEKNKQFPKEVVEGRLSGDAIIWIKVASSGQILEFELKQRTPYKLLNEAISAMIEKSNPFPPFPLGYPVTDYDEFTFPVNINYENLQ